MSNLKRMSEDFETGFWVDSCGREDLKYGLEHGAIGATTNPIIVKNVLANDMALYEDELKRIIKENPEMVEDDVAWKMIELLAKEAAKTLEPIFDPSTGVGRISIQTNNKYFKNADKLVEQAAHFNTLAKNIQVKIPATKAGIQACEEATYRGISINATVCFTTTQAVAVAEAVERGLKKRAKEGLDNSCINPVCTIMVGRMDDYIKSVVKNEERLLTPEALEYSGIACAKRYYEIHKERGYKTKLLTAAFRNIHHWSEMIGGDILATIPNAFERKINGSAMAVKSRIDNPVNQEYLDELMTIHEFVKGYEPDGMTPEEFDSYGAVRVTLQQFFGGYDELITIIRSYMV